MKKDIICQPVELIDEDLDVIAGGDALIIDVGVNVAVVDQLTVQIQTLTENVLNSATTSATVAQTS